MANALSHEWFIDAAVAEIDRLAWIADGADPAAPVPSCPGWSMAKLVKHTGTVHRWVTEIVKTRATQRVDPRSLDLGLPDKESDYAGWLTDGAGPLADALRAAGPRQPVWAWTGGGQTADWWARRVLHETTVHRADAELASRAPIVIDPVAAADGIDEFLLNVSALPRLAERLAELPAGQSLHLHATDADGGDTDGGDGAAVGGEWLIRFTGSGIETERGHAKATAAVRGRLALLLLFAYGRIAPDDAGLAAFGDTGLLALWQQKAAL